MIPSRWDPSLPISFEVKRGHWKTFADGSELTEGFWTLEGLHTMEPSRERCPYCQGALLFVDAAVIARIVKVEGRTEAPGHDVTDGLIQVLPPDRLALGCRTCVQMFTLPIGGEDDEPVYPAEA